MANVNDMFNEVTKEQSFYRKGKKKEFTPFAKGEYLGHITEVDSRVVDVKGGQYKARLYTYTVEVANENKTKSFNYEGIDGKPVATKGDVYVGCKFRGKLWRFLEHAKDDTFESNAEGNSAYLRFCETIGIKCPTEVKNIGGEDIEVKLLPSLSADDILGQPVIAFVDKGKPFTDKKGNKRQYFDCKFCKKWDDGKRKNITSGGKNEIPF